VQNPTQDVRDIGPMILSEVKHCLEKVIHKAELSDKLFIVCNISTPNDFWPVLWVWVNHSNLNFSKNSSYTGKTKDQKLAGT
jgi:hypothetical protein